MFVALVLVGWCLLTLLQPRHPVGRSVPLALALPASIGLSLSVVSIAAWLGWATRTGMRGVAAISVVAALGLIVARFVPRSWQRRASPPARGSLRDPGGTSPRSAEVGWADLGPGLLALGSLVLALADGPWLSQTADTFYHLAAARSLLRTQSALPQDIFFGVQVPYPDDTSGSLHVVLAWLSLLTGLIPAWTALTAFGAAFTVLAFAALAKELTRSTPASIAATSLYIVLWLDLDMRTAGYPNRIGPGLVWLTLVFLVRFVRAPGRESWPELAIAALLAIAAGSVHSGMAPFLVVIVSTTFGAAALIALWRRDLRPLWPLAIACAVVMVATLPVLVLRILAIPTPGPDGWLFTEAPPIKTHVILGYPFVDFRFWFDSVVTITTVGTACLLGRARIAWLAGDIGGATLVGAILVVPAVSVTPILARWPEGLYYFARISDLLLPLMFVTIGWELVWAVPRLLSAVRGLRAPGSTDRSVIPAAALAVAVLVLLGEYVPQGAYTRYFGSDQLTVAASHHNDLTQRWADRLRALEAAGPGTLLADLDASYEIAGLSGRRIVAVSFSHIPYQDQARDGMLRLGDVLDAMRPSSDPKLLMSVLVRYHVKLVMVDLAKDGQATWDWIGGQAALVQLAAGSGWRLYRFEDSRLDQELQLPLSGDAGLAPVRTIAGRAVFARFTVPGRNRGEIVALGVKTGATFRSSFTLPETTTGVLATEPLLFPDTAPVDTYRVTVSGDGVRDLTAGTVAVGRDYEAESFAGIIDFFYNGGFIRNPGWLTTYGPYSRGVAATGLRAESVASRPLLDPPGDYCLDVRVLNRGDGRMSALEVDAGGTVVSVTWGDQNPGLQDLLVPIHAGPATHQIRFWVPTGSALPVTVDSLTLFPGAAASC
jgi:hypothetical protein